MSKRSTFRWIAIFFCFGLWIYTAITALTGNAKDKEGRVVTAFTKAKCIDCKSNIGAFGQYGVLYLNDNAKETILRDMAKKIGINNYIISKDEEENISTMQLTQTAKNGEVVLKVITVERAVESSVIEARQYISIEIGLNSSTEGTLAYEKIVKDIIKGFGIDTQVTVTMSGAINGKLDSALKDVVKDDILEELDAKVVSEQCNDELYTVYEYTDNIDDYVSMASSKINLNLSMSYNEEKDITEVVLATPLNSQPD